MNLCAVEKGLRSNGRAAVLVTTRPVQPAIGEQGRGGHLQMQRRKAGVYDQGARGVSGWKCTKRKQQG